MFERYLDKSGFVEIPFTKGFYLITQSGEIRDTFGNEVLIERDEEGDAVVKLCLWDGGRSYKVHLLVAFTFKPIQIPVALWKKLSVMFADGNRRNIHPKNLVWKFPIGLESNRYPGYAFIPCFTRYVISRFGDVIDTVTGTKRKFFQSQGYFCVGLRPDVGKTKVHSRHRLLCSAWKEYPANVDKLDVNHINGIKGSDDLDNLEWATRKRNCDHAYSTGLRTDNVQILTRNVLTGEIKEYYSFGDCARQLGGDDEGYRARCDSRGQWLYPGYLQFKRKDDPTEWKMVDDPIIELRGRGFPTPIIVKDVLTEKVDSFETVSDAAKETGLNNASIAFYLQKKKSFKPLLNYVFKFKEDGTPWPEYTSDELEVIKQCTEKKRHLKSPGYRVIEKDTGKVSIYAFPDDVKRDYGFESWITLRIANGQEHEKVKIEFVFKSHLEYSMSSQ